MPLTPGTRLGPYEIATPLGAGFYLSATAGFVSKWIPLSQMFWARATTVAFAAAAIALLSGRFALLAARLLALMIVVFGLLIWVEQPFSDPHQLTNWAGNAENLSIAGAAWIGMDYFCGSGRLASDSKLDNGSAAASFALGRLGD